MDNQKPSETNDDNKTEILGHNNQEFEVEVTSQKMSISDIENLPIDKLVRNRINKDKFSYENQLGEGGMGIVLEVKENDIKRKLAFKVMKEDFIKNRTSVLRFIEEAQITGQLEHPNIVPVHEFGLNSQDRLAFTMKLVKGRSLKEIIDDEKDNNLSISIIEKLNIFMKVCDAISFAHSVNVIHRDLKSENVMIGEFGEVLVMDWGLAKVIGSKNLGDDEILKSINTIRKDVHQQDLTVYGSYVGTPAFMSPEQAIGKIERIDRQSDVFSLGAILYNMLTLELPVSGKSIAEVLDKISTGDINSPNHRPDIKKKIPKELDAIIMKAMSFKKSDRYKSVKDFKKDIESYLANEKVSAYKDSFGEKALKWSKRNPAKAMGSVVSIVFLLIIVIIISITLSQIQAGKLKAEQLARDKEKKEFELKEERRRALLQSGQIDKLKEDLGVKLTYQRDKAADEFITLWNKGLADGKTEKQIINKIGKDKIQTYIKAFENIIEMSRKYNQIYYTAKDFYRLGLLYYYSENNDKALENFRTALDLKLEIPEVYNSCGLVYLYLKDYDNALKNFDKAIDLDPQSTTAYINKGCIFLDSNDLNQALKYFNTAIDIDPTVALAYNNRGRVYLLLNDYTRALEDYSEAINYDPNLAVAYANRGYIYLQQQNYDAAIKDYNDAIELAPRYLVALVNRGNAYARKQDYKQALINYDAAIEIDPEYPFIYINRGIANSYLKNYKESISDYFKVIELSPENSLVAYYNITCLYSLKSSTAETEEEKEKDIDMALNNLELLIEKGWTDFEAIKKDTDFENIRNHPRFKKLMEGR